MENNTNPESSANPAPLSTPETQAPMAQNVDTNGGMPAPTTLETTSTPPVPETPSTAPEVMNASDVVPAQTEVAPKEHKSVFDMIKGMFGGRTSATTPASTSPIVTTENTPAAPAPAAPESAPAPFAPAPPTNLPKA